MRGIKGNFPGLYRGDLTCSLGCQEANTQRHLLVCPRLLAQLGSVDEALVRAVCMDQMYGSGEKQKMLVTMVTRLMELREEMQSEEQAK